MSAFAGTKPGRLIEKIMTLSRREFDTSIKRLALSGASGSGDAKPADAIISEADDVYKMVLAGTSATIAVEIIEPMLMGGLVKLARCRVVIKFGETAVEQRLAFLNRFDQAFQRGGG